MSRLGTNPHRFRLVGVFRGLLTLVDLVATFQCWAEWPSSWNTHTDRAAPTGFGCWGFSVAEFIVLYRVLGMEFLGLCLVPILAFTVFALIFYMAIYHGWFLRGG